MKARYIDSILGRFTAMEEDGVLIRIDFSGQRDGLPHQVHWCETGENALLDQAAEEISGYCQGLLRGFSVPFRMNGTLWQEAVWEQIRAIPYGQTRSYGEIAKILGGTGRARAVGMAAGANILPLLIPCHRVIGADGGLTGFSAGIAMKKKLLMLEGAKWSV